MAVLQIRPIEISPNSSSKGSRNRRSFSSLGRHLTDRENTVKHYIYQMHTSYNICTLKKTTTDHMIIVHYKKNKNN